MASQKITALTAKTTPVAADLLVLVDSVGTETKKITFANLMAAYAPLASPTFTGTVTLPDVTFGAAKSIYLSSSTSYIVFRAGAAAAGSGAMFEAYGTGHAGAGLWYFKTPNAAGNADVTRVTLTGNLATAVWTFADVTVAGLVLSGALTLNGQVFDAGSGNAEIDTTGLAKGLEIISTQDGAAGAMVRLINVSTSPAAADQVALFQGTGKSDGSPQNTINYGTIYFNITSPTKTAETGDLDIYLYNGGVNNQALHLTGPGVLSVDLAGSGTPAQVDLFDSYDDALALRDGIQRGNREILANMGVLTRKDTGSGYMMNLQPMVRLLAGGIYQGRQQLDDLRTELMGRLAKVEQKLLSVK
jgi:hypothetical protein